MLSGAAWRKQSKSDRCLFAAPCLDTARLSFGKCQTRSMTTDLHRLTDELEHLTSELRMLVNERQHIAIQQKQLVEISVSLQREYAEQVDRTLGPMLAKHSAPARPQLQG